MDCYTNAWGYEQAAVDLLSTGRYQQSIFLCCLAVELYLKSKLHLVPHDDDLETSHDVIRIYNALTSRYQPKTNHKLMIVRCRKYFNESRYPSAVDVSVYTKDFASEFIDFVAAIRDFIDNECVATIDDLKGKYSDD